MRVSEWKETHRGGVLRLSAAITWEDQDRPDATLWFEWSADLADSVRAEPDAALIATYPLAMFSGEQRLHVAGHISSRLADGVESAMAVIAEQWPAYRPVRLELTHGTLPVRERGREAGVCFSGGVDALAAVQQNIRTSSVGDRERFTSALFIFGLNTYDFVDGAPSAERLAAYEAHAGRLEAFANATGMALLRCTTNLRALYPSFDAWFAVANTSYLAATGHLMRPRLASLALGSSGTGRVAGVTPPPLIDPLYSTDTLQVYGAQVMTTRIEKVRRLADWPEGLAVLRVCLLIEMPEGGTLNCGQCDKCVRTMLELLALGDDALARAPFPATDVSAELAQNAMRTPYGRAFCAELVPLFAARGRNDLAVALSNIPAPRAEAPQPWWRLRGR